MSTVFCLMHLMASKLAESAQCYAILKVILDRNNRVAQNEENWEKLTSLGLTTSSGQGSQKKKKWVPTYFSSSGGFSITSVDPPFNESTDHGLIDPKGQPTYTPHFEPP